MRNRRALLHLSLAGLLVLFQQISIAHALSHLSDAEPHSPARQDQQHPADKVCVQCVALAHFGSALTSNAPLFLAGAAHIDILAAAIAVFRPGFIPAFQSRAPPVSA
jgi:hypothetical protein